jgi:hypothetical protein
MYEPQPHRDGHLSYQQVVMLEVHGVWLLWHVEVAPPQ